MPVCQKCHSPRFVWKGRSGSGGKRFKCKDCGTWGVVHDTKESYTSYGECSEVTVETPRRVRNERDLIELLEIDTNEWQIERFTVGKSEGYRKDRSVEWLVENGRVVSGEVHDSGSLKIEPLFSVKVWLRRRTKEIRAKLAVEDLTRDAQRFAPKYPKIHYPKIKDGLLYEVCVPDAHLGKLVWGEESGENCDLKSQTLRVVEAVKDLLTYARHYPVERILFPFGNDFYNSDNQNNTTTGGTPMSEDSRWQKAFRAGRVLAVQLIDMCAAIAPVDVLIIAGNHDEERCFFLGDSLSSWYRNCPNVTINNSAKKRKYFLFGKTLLGFTHGDKEKPDKLSGLMSIEEPGLWARSQFREWHIGHLHHLREQTLEQNGVVVRTLRSLSPTDSWHYQHGFVGAVQAAESFLWDKERGLLASFVSVATPNPD